MANDKSKPLMTENPIDSLADANRLTNANRLSDPNRPADTSRLGDPNRPVDTSRTVETNRLADTNTNDRKDKKNVKLVTGIFKNRLAAQAAVDVLMSKGYTQKDISILMTDSTRSKEFGIESGNKAGEGAGVGGVVGGSIVATIAAIAAIGTTLVLPGLGLIVAGPLAAAIAGAGAGGMAGSLIGALVGAGIPEHRAKVYDAGLREGGILLGVEARSADEATALEALLESRGGEQIKKE